MAKKRAKIVKLKPREYQPSKAELEEPVNLEVPKDMPMEEYVRRVFRPVRVEHRDE